jgi:hypothetical protein
MTEKKIEGDKKNRPMVELIANAGETTADLFVSNPALKELPVVDWAFKVIKAFDGFRSWLLARKIEKFLSEPSLIKAAEANKMRERVLFDEDYAQDVGETLLMVLDKVTDFSKPVLLAKSYAAFLDGEIDQYALAMLWSNSYSSMSKIHQSTRMRTLCGAPVWLVPDCSVFIFPALWVEAVEDTIWLRWERPS